MTMRTRKGQVLLPPPPPLVAALVVVACLVGMAPVCCGNEPQRFGEGGALRQRAWSGKELDVLFTAFVTRHGRAYTANATEHAFRRAVFAHNLELYQQRSATNDTLAYGHTAVFKPDKFADWTPEEFRAMLGARSSTDTALLSSGCTGTPVDCDVLTSDKTPHSFDWRDDKRGAITGVRNQAQCGGCWAFSAVETIEAAWTIAGHKLPGSQLSVQQVLSCDTDHSNGCGGGQIPSAFDYVLKLSDKGKGLETESAFPFKCADGCSSKSAPRCPALSNPYVRINSTCRCIDMSEKAMRRYIANYGPLAIKVDAEPWNGYSSGILRYHCSSLQASGDHAVQIVGYGVDKSTGNPIPYWVVRNSWGSDWGENGYIRLYRGANVCGVANDVNFAFSP